MKGISIHFKVGEFDCIAIKDAEDENIHMNVLLVQTGQQVVLIDTGLGADLWSGFAGLLKRLAELKITPDDIDVVILSHADFDHIGGAVNDGKPTFSRARHYLLQEELDFWSRKPQRIREDANIDAGMRDVGLPSSFLRLEQLRDKLEPVVSGNEVVPGIRMVSAGGHTPGHAVIEVTSNHERLWFIGDMLYTPEDIHDPEWYAVSDFDPARAVATRKRLLPQLVREQIRVMGYHLPFPGIGYFSEYGQGWTWTAHDPKKPGQGGTRQSGSKPISTAYVFEDATMMLNRTFHEIEHEAWAQRASFYDDLFAGISAQAIAPILDSLGDLECKPHLDVACGTGHLVEAASKRGAISTGIDFAEPMIAAARVNYPKQNFRVADATALPYEDESFDAVTCSFGLAHMEFPQTAVQEAFRVLKPGGRLAFTLWCGADDGGELLAITRQALAYYAASQTPVLPGSPLQYADAQICENIVRQAGFERPAFVKIPSVIQSSKAQTMFDVIGKLSIRTRALLDSQPPPLRQRIVDHILSEIETHRLDGLITMAWPALLTITQKPI